MMILREGFSRRQCQSQWWQGHDRVICCIVRCAVLLRDPWIHGEPWELSWPAQAEIFR